MYTLPIPVQIQPMLKTKYAVGSPNMQANRRAGYSNGVDNLLDRFRAVVLGLLVRC